jgi:superfamily II DNA or RNA helicase
MRKFYLRMMKDRPWLQMRSWQERVLKDKKVRTEAITVIAAGTGSGKTFATIMDLELFFLDPKNKGKKALVLASAQTNLRQNFDKSLENFKPSFKWCTPVTGKELIEASKSDCDVIVCIPQTAASVYEELPEFDTLVLDEAHTWYFAKTVQNILTSTKPRRQLLLTGTPYPFVEKGNFNMFFVSVMELFDEGFISDPTIEVITSDCDFSNTDYNSFEELKEDAFDKYENKYDKLLKGVCVEMVKKLRNPIKELRNINRFTNDVGGLLFNHLGKTIIWTRNKDMADVFGRVLNKCKGIENKVLVSHSGCDKDSKNMESFKDPEQDIKVLVVVDRAKLGWDYPELANAVDFTMTRNPSTIQQMLARLFRVPKNKTIKTYYKVANSYDANYYIKVMEAVLMLLFEYWMKKYNGKNLDGMMLPRVIEPQDTLPKRPSKGRRKKGSNNVRSITEVFKKPLSLTFFRDNIFHKSSDKFASIAWATLGDTRREVYGLFNRVTPEFCRQEAKKYNSIQVFRKEQGYTAEVIRNNNMEEECYSHMMDWVYKQNEDNKDFISKELAKYKGMTFAELEKAKGPIPGKLIFGGYWLYTRAKQLGINYGKILGLRAVKLTKDSFTKKQVIAECKKYRNLTELAAANFTVANYMDKFGLKEEMKQYYTDHRGTIDERFDLETVIALAKKCKTATDFVRNHGSAYRWILKYDCKEEVYRHIKSVRRSRIVKEVTSGTVGTIKELAAKYNVNTAHINMMIKGGYVGKPGKLQGKQFKVIN